MNRLISTLRRSPGRPLPRVVIAGANFAGLETAVHLSHDCCVTVIDPRLAFEFTPNIHELVSGYRKPEELRLDKDAILGQYGHEFYQDRVTAIDSAASRVTTASGLTFDYDACVVAVGGANNPGNVPDPANRLMPFKSVRDCQSIGIRLQQLAAAGRPFRILIIGGGLEGIESLGEILRAYRHKNGIGIDLVEAGNRLLASAPRSVDREIRAICRELPVAFHCNDRLRKLSKKQAMLDSGKRIPADIIIWTGGILPPPELTAWGLKRADERWAPVSDTFQSRYSENIFVVGDAAMLPSPVSKQAYHAIDMGRHAADNLRRLFSGKPLAPFAPSEKPMLVSFGDLDAFMLWRGRALAGTGVSAAKEAVYQYNMARFDPARRLKFVSGTLQRVFNGGMRIAEFHLSSIEALRRLGNIRIL